VTWASVLSNALFLYASKLEQTEEQKSEIDTMELLIQGASSNLEELIKPRNIRPNMDQLKIIEKGFQMTCHLAKIARSSLENPESNTEGQNSPNHLMAAEKPTQFHKIREKTKQIICRHNGNIETKNTAKQIMSA